MTLTLPRAFVRQTIGATTIVRVCVGLGLLAGLACRHDPPPVAPGPPLPAEPDIAVSTMQTECTAMEAALTSYRACKNLEDDDRYEIDAWIERAHIDYAAGVKANPEPKAQHAIAVACRRATDSITAAHERCTVGPRPRDR